MCYVRFYCVQNKKKKKKLCTNVIVSNEFSFNNMMSEEPNVHSASLESPPSDFKEYSQLLETKLRETYINVRKVRNYIKILTIVNFCSLLILLFVILAKIEKSYYKGASYGAAW